MSDNEQENENRETVADIVAEMRKRCTPYAKSDSADCRYIAYLGYKEFADRIEAACKRERDLIRSCARWILAHDIYGHMSKELLAECKNVLGDDGQFLNK